MAKYGQNGSHLNSFPSTPRPKYGMTASPKAPDAPVSPAPDAEAEVVEEVVAPVAEVVNNDPTSAWDHRAELEALPDGDLYEMVKDLPDFDESWTRADFISRLLDA